MGKRKRDSYAGSSGYYGSWGYNYANFTPAEVREATQPLIDQVRRYDNARLLLENVGGETADLVAITEILDKTFGLRGRTYNSSIVKLSEPETARTGLADIDYDLNMDVRLADDTMMPLYYICRVRNDYWREYSLIVEDLYVSPGYDLLDARFAKLMRSGRDLYFIRLSQFRDEAARMLGLDTANGQSESQLDDLLFDLGRFIFQAAWHEDQRLAVAVAEAFSIPNFRHTVELLYLCLSGDLCGVRTAVSPEMVQFFTDVYDQPAISGLLRQIEGLDGGALTKIPQAARTGYSGLLKEFDSFLSMEVAWSRDKIAQPLWKLVYSNMDRLDLVEDEIANAKQLATAAGRLDAAAEATTKLLVND